jgi:ParB family chromosome partitioning protein
VVLLRDMKATPKTGLGRGLDSLIPQNFDKSLLLETGEKIQNIELHKIAPHKGQPRTTFDKQGLAELAASITEYGVLQPIIVRPPDSKHKEYVIVAGERRWRASQLAGLKHVPAIVRSLQDLEHLELALVENVQRVDLSPLEQAVSIERLHQQFSLSYDSIARKLAKANSTVTNIVRLLQLPEAAREALERGDITEGHARAVLSLKADADKQQELLDSIIHYGWSVRQAERFVTSVKAGATAADTAKTRVETETPATKVLSARLGAPVQIRRTAHGGRLELQFASDTELERLLALLNHL